MNRAPREGCPTTALTTYHLGARSDWSYPGLVDSSVLAVEDSSDRG
jgi:hypothetical protein